MERHGQTAAPQLRQPNPAAHQVRFTNHCRRMAPSFCLVQTLLKYTYV